MKKVLTVMFAFVVMLALAAAGCVEPEETTGEAKPETVEDYLGREITLEQAPERIVSLMPSKTEKLFALGLGDVVVGVTDLCDYPEEMQERDITSVGDAFSLSVEIIVTLQPDLVVANWLPEGLESQLLDLGITVFQYNPGGIEDVMESIDRLGKLTGRQEAAEQITAGMRADLAEIAARVEAIDEDDKIRVLYLLDEFLYTGGKGTLQDDLVTLAGGINVVEEAGWPLLNEEAFLAANPDVILFTFPGGEKFLQKTQWQDLGCISEGRIYKLDESLASRTGPRLIQGLQQIFAVLYPDR